MPEEVVDTMPPEIIRVYKRAKVYQLDLKELENQNEAKPPRLLDNFNLTKNTNVFDLIKLVRNFLNIDFQTQKSWENFDEAIEKWRNVLITFGIYIFKDAFRNNKYSGFSLYDKNYPVILINNTIPKARQIFTIFHEISHLLFKAGGVDLLEESFFNRLQADYYAIEQMCNKFAGEFLLPIAEFKDNFPAFNEGNLTKMANAYKVSREVILRKYLDSNLVSSETYNMYTKKWLKEYLDSRENKKDNKSRGNHYNTKRAYLGEYYVNLVFSHYYQGRIDMEVLANYLDEKVSNIPTFEGYVLR
jgi:Zn-dependent peptidase ImmA (M78 family)